MNNLLLILGILALSNGNISLFGNNKNDEDKLRIDKMDIKKSINNKESEKIKSKGKKVRKIKKIKKISKNKSTDKNKSLRYNMEDIKKGINLMDLTEEELDRGMEIITRTKKYMSQEERKMLIKIESILDLVKGIKKLNSLDILGEEEESQFFTTMDEEDKKNMMISEILEVFPEKRKESLEKAIDMKKKIDLFAELFLPDSEEGFSLGSLADISNLGSINNIKLLGSLLRGDSLDLDENENKYESCDYKKENEENNNYYNESYYVYEDYEESSDCNSLADSKK